MGTWVLAIFLNIFSVPVFDRGCSESGFSRQMSIVKSELSNDHIAFKRKPLISFAVGPLGSPTSPDFGISRLLWSGRKCRLSIVGNSFYYFCKYTLDTLLETTHCMWLAPTLRPTLRHRFSVQTSRLKRNTETCPGLFKVCWCRNSHLFLPYRTAWIYVNHYLSLLSCFIISRWKWNCQFLEPCPEVWHLAIYFKGWPVFFTHRAFL